jgi:hypothetical protein
VSDLYHNTCSQFFCHEIWCQKKLFVRVLMSYVGIICRQSRTSM